MNWLAVEDTIRRALTEDLGHGDISTELLPESGRHVAAGFLAKQAGVLCGAEVAVRCFTLLDMECRAEFSKLEGSVISAGEMIGRVEGAARSILSAERVALNFLQHLSGIATLSRRLAQRAAPHGIRVVETRKTTPGLRTLEKYAVRVGGGFNHRMDLDHCVMLKDNHFASASDDPASVVRTVKARMSHTVKLIAEAQTPAMAQELALAGADIVLLDNFRPAQIAEAVALIDQRSLIEVSGGVNEGNLDEFLIAGVDVISIGALTHSAAALDISLQFETRR